MTKDGIISAIIAIVLFVVGSAVSPGWFIDTFTANPIGAALCVSIALMIGYFICLLVHHKFVRLEEEVSQLRNDKTMKELYIKELEDRNKLLNDKLAEYEIASTNGQSCDEANESINIRELSRKIEEERRYRLYQHGKLG
jgi:mannitol-specific phosphotransferase system IIBC component